MSNVEEFPISARRLTEFDAIMAAAPSVLEAIPGAVYVCDHDGWLFPTMPKPQSYGDDSLRSLAKESAIVVRTASFFPTIRPFRMTNVRWLQR